MTSKVRILTAAVLIGTASVAAEAQSDIPVMKDASSHVSSTTTTSYGDVDWTGPLGYTLRPGAAALYCSEGDVEEVAKVEIKSDLYRAGMITPDQAKALALCAVPGQIGSGEMEMANDRPIYDISLIPNGKQTYSKVQIDAYTGEVINAKQFGGLRGLAGFLRESAERKQNKAKTDGQP